MPINPNIKNQIQKKPLLSVEEYMNGILSGDRNILSQAITIVESKLPEHQKTAQEIIEKCLPHASKSTRLGITGIPGVGKSTFIECFGKYIIEQGKRLAVLAIDPSSKQSQGSILGDKTRMQNLSLEENVFIRPSPTAGSLGGVAQKTHQTILLCEAAGFDFIIVETVGVGQSETMVYEMVDFFLLLMLAGAGDELQGIKRGIMEMADLLAINKADGDNLKKAKLAKTQYQSALHLFPPKKSGWTVKVQTCSALENQGMDEIWKSLVSYLEITKANLYFEKRRKVQAKFWFYQSIENQLKNQFFENQKIKKQLPEFEKSVLDGKISAYLAAEKLLKVLKTL